MSLWHDVDERLAAKCIKCDRQKANQVWIWEVSRLVNFSFVYLFVHCLCSHEHFIYHPWKRIFQILQLSGIPIFTLNRKLMGCLNFPLWIGITIGSVVVLVIVVAIVINRKLEAMKFFLFMRFNYLVNDDPPEDVDNLEFDAFVSFRYGNKISHSQESQK